MVRTRITCPPPPPGKTLLAGPEEGGVAGGSGPGLAERPSAPETPGWSVSWPRLPSPPWNTSVARVSLPTPWNLVLSPPAAFHVLVTARRPVKQLLEGV